MNIAFAGLRHVHIFDLYKLVQEDQNYTILGAFEQDEDAKKQAEKMGVPCNYASFEQLLADPKVEVVALGGRYGDRGGMAIRALRCGKHIMADKPLCTTLEELDVIENLAKETGRKVSCMFTMRFEKKVQAVKDLIATGKLGEVNNVYFGGQHPLQYGRRPQWYYAPGSHGGVINDIAIHGIDFLHYVLGLDVATVLAARCWNKFAEEEPNFKDSAQIMFTASNGAGVLSDISYAIPDGIEFSLPQYWQFYIWGTKGMISFSLNEKESFYYLAGCEKPHLLEETPVRTGYLEDFLRLVSGEKSLVLPMDEVFQSTRATLQIQQLAQNG